MQETSEFALKTKQYSKDKANSILTECLETRGLAQPALHCHNAMRMSVRSVEPKLLCHSAILVATPCDARCLSKGRTRNVSMPQDFKSCPLSAFKVCSWIPELLGAVQRLTLPSFGQPDIEECPLVATVFV